MFSAGSGAQGGYGVADAGLGEGDNIHIALDDDNALEFAVRPARLVETVELAALVENGRLGRVQVFGFIVPENPTPKGDDTAPAIPDREDNAVPKAVIDPSGVVFDQHARRDGGVFCLFAVPEKTEQVVPARRGKAQTKVAGDDAGQAAIFKVVDGLVAIGMLF